MNRDIDTQVREYTEFFQGSIDAVEMEEILHRRIGDGPVRPVGRVRSSRGRGWTVAAVAAVVTVVVVGSVAWLSGSDGDVPVVDESPRVTDAITPTTEAPITTSTAGASTTTLAAIPVVPPGGGPRLGFVQADSPYDDFTSAGGVWFAGALYLLPDGDGRDAYRSRDGLAWELVPGNIPDVDRWGGGRDTKTDGSRLVNVAGTETWGACLGPGDSLWVNTSQDGIDWTSSEIPLSLLNTTSNAGCFTNYGADFAVGPEGIVVTASVSLEVGGRFLDGLVNPDDGVHVEIADIDLEQGTVTIRFIEESTGALVDTKELDGIGKSLADLLEAMTADSGWEPLAETVLLQLADDRWPEVSVTRGFAWFSADGQTWVPIDFDALDGREFTDIVAVGEGFWASGRSANTPPWLVDDISMWRSADGVSWSETTLAVGMETLNDRSGVPRLYEWNGRPVVGSRNGVIAIGDEPVELIGRDWTTQMGIIEIGGLGLVAHANEMDDAGTEVLYSADGSAWSRWTPQEFGPDPGHLYMMGVGDDFVVLQLIQETGHSLWVGRQQQ